MPLGCVKRGFIPGYVSRVVYPVIPGYASRVYNGVYPGVPLGCVRGTMRRIQLSLSLTRFTVGLEFSFSLFPVSLLVDILVLVHGCFMCRVCCRFITRFTVGC